MKKIIVLGIIISLCLVLSESPSYGFALNISPPSLKLSVKPAGSTSGTITVRNKSEGSIGIIAYTQDWVYNPDGTKSFYATGTTPLSCAKWIHLFPKKFQIGPGENMGVQYTINAPEDTTGGYYAVIFFESVPPGGREEDEGMLVQFAGRLGTIVYLDIEGKSFRKGAIESLSVMPPQSDKPLLATFSFKNTGNTYIGAEGVLNIIDEEGNLYGKKIFGPVNTLPNETREAKVEWLGELEEGTYYAVVTLDIGTDEPLVGEVKIDVFSGGVISGLSVDATSEMPSFSVAVKNTGHFNINTGGRIEIISQDRKVIRTLNLTESLIAPGKEKELMATLDKVLPEGIYTAKAVISIGTKELTKEEVFTIK